MIRDPEEIGAKMDALGLWGDLEPFNWAVKPHGTALPYFCSVLKSAQPPVKVRLLMLEGWQTLHDYVRLRVDRNFGFYTMPMEFPHFELIVLDDGSVKIFRDDPGYMPREVADRHRELVGRILWEAYGVMLRVESDHELPMRFASDRAIFARVETKPGEWIDSPLSIPNPAPYVEQISFAKADLQKARDLAIVPDLVWDVDFRMLPQLMTREPRPRSVYGLKAVDPKQSALVVDRRVSLNPDNTLRSLWEQMPTQLMLEMIAHGKVPGEIRTMSGRVFRMLRPLGVELPFKLSLHVSLPTLDAAFA